LIEVISTLGGNSPLVLGRGTDRAGLRLRIVVGDVGAGAVERRVGVGRSLVWLMTWLAFQFFFFRLFGENVISCTRAWVVTLPWASRPQ
jgi:hypothetical protein